MQTKEQTQHVKNLERALALVKSKEEFSRSDVDDLIRWSRLGGEPPVPTGFDERGVPFWSREDFTAWADAAPKVRSTVAEQTRVVERGEVRSKTWNPEDRTFTAVAASEQPVRVMDWNSGGVINEILVAEGGRFNAETPLHVDHNTSVDRLVGRAFTPRREGTFWIVGCQLDNDPYSRAIGDKVGSGSINSLSIGYRIHAWEMVYPGRSAVIGGRTFTVADGEPALRVVTDWSVHEISLVSIPADSNAKIRAAQPFLQRNNSMPAVAIHSRNSVTSLPRVGAFVSATLMERGISDPTKHRYALTIDGVRRLAPCVDLERDAEEGVHLMGLDPLRRLRKALELDGIRAADTTEVLDRLHQLTQQRSFSTSNAGAMFNDELVSLLYSRYDAGGDSTRGWCAENDLLTTRATPRPMLGGVTLTIQPRGGQANHLHFSATSETAQLACYSGYFVLDEQDILDGSWGDRAAAAAIQIGDGAKALRPNLVYSFLRRNPIMADGVALFHADHGNLNTTAPLATAGKLAAALAGIAKQKYGDQSLNLRGEYLITPVSLQGAGAGAIQSLELLDDESTQPPKLRTDSRLDNGLVDPTDGTGETVHAPDESTWYASTAGEYGIEVQYRSGFNRAPEFRSGVLEGRGSFGMWFDIRHFLGVAAVGYQGVSKNVAS